MSRSRVVFAATSAVFLLFLLSGCAGSGVDLGGGSVQAIGDENGGKIPNALGSTADQTAAYRLVTSHCEKFGKKGFIIKMDYDSGTVTFDCRVIKRNPTG